MMEHYQRVSKEPRILGGIGKINYGKQYRQGNRIYDSDACAMALNASPLGNSGGYTYLYLIRIKHDKDSMHR